MIDAISLMATSIQQDVQRMNVIAQNTANALTTGFKREYLATASLLDVEPSSLGAKNSLPIIPALQVMTDRRPGVTRQTESPFDLALLGEGYFEIYTDTGLAYTRQGAFRLNDQGYLVNSAGFHVAGVSGDIRLTTEKPTIDREGRIFENDKQIAQLKVVTFDSPLALTNIGGGLAVANNGANKREIEHPAIGQGQLESSNVDSAQEMVKLVETFRHFETSHRILQAYDDMHDKALQKLGQF